MSGAKPGAFDKAAFVAAVKAADRRQGAEEPRRGRQVRRRPARPTRSRREVGGKVAEGKDEGRQGHQRQDHGRTRPVQGRREGRQAAGTGAGATAAVGGRRRGDAGEGPAEQTDLTGGQQGDRRRDGRGRASPRSSSRQSNEPEFTGAVAEKKKGEEHSATAPQQFRESEAEQLDSDQAAGVRHREGGTRRACSARRSDAREGRGEQDRRQGEGRAGAGRGSPRRSRRIFDTTKTEVDRHPRRSRHGGRPSASRPARSRRATRSPPTTSGGWTPTRTTGTPASSAPARWIARQVRRPAAGGQQDLPPSPRSSTKPRWRPASARSPTSSARELTPGQGQDRRGPHQDQGVRRPAAEEPAEVRRRDGGQVRRAVRPARERRRQQAGRARRGPRHEVRRGAQGRRRRDQGDAGGEQGPVGQGQGRHRRRHQDDPEAQGHAARRPRPRRQRHRQDHQGPDRLPRQLRQRRQGRHHELRRRTSSTTSRPACKGWLFGALAERRHRAAREVRPAGHHQAGPQHPRPDLGEHPRPHRQAHPRSDHGQGREGRRVRQDRRSRTGSAASGSGCWRRSATSRTW